VAAEIRWLWSTRYGQLAILAVLTGLVWVSGLLWLGGPAWLPAWGTPVPMLLALTRRRLLGADWVRSA
jgi:hypothetical protein